MFNWLATLFLGIIALCCVLLLLGFGTPNCCTVNNQTAGTVLSGSGDAAGVTTPSYSIPGGIISIDDENFSQVPMPAGTLSGLRVKSTPMAAPSTTGTLTVTVKINGQPTVLTCAMANGIGLCSSGSASVTINDGDLLSVEFSNNQVIGNAFYTYSFLHN